MTTEITQVDIDAAKGWEYARIANSMRSDASAYEALASAVQEDPTLLTFAAAYADGIRREYRKLAEFCLMAADQADELARHYSAHAAGADMTLRAV